MIYYYTYPSHSSRYYYYTTETVTNSNTHNSNFWLYALIGLGVIIGCVALFFLIRHLIDVFSYRSHGLKEKKEMTIDTLTYILLLIGEISTVVCTVIGKCDVFVTFIPIGIGVVYNLVMKIGAMILFSKATKNSNVTNETLDAFKKLMTNK